MSAGERARAARNVGAVLRDRTIDQALETATQSPLTLELTYGALRHYFSLSRELSRWLEHPPQDPDLRGLLLVGAYQLRHTRVPDHAAVNETVAACRDLGKSWARGLVNGVLRNVARARDVAQAPNGGGQQDAVRGDAVRDDVEHYEHPRWLIDRLRAQYGAAAEAVLVANNHRAPLCLRVNRSRADPAQYAALLADTGSSHRSAWLPETLILDSPVPAASLPGYAQGLVAVQDAGAQFAAHLLADKLAPGTRVLDACAAPGGKAFHLLERCPGIELTAVDRSAQRLGILEREGERLGHNPVVRCADAERLDAWWDGRPFDAVVCDAPCTGTGTLRRHPDIKVRLTPERLDRHVATQTSLIASLWRVLRPGGTLLYCTCSMLQEENDSIVGSLVNATGAVASPITLPTGAPTRYGWQLLPSEPLTDGFYYAIVVKPA